MRPEPGLKGCSSAHAQAERGITVWADKHAKAWGGERALDVHVCGNVCSLCLKHGESDYGAI